MAAPAARARGDGPDHRPSVVVGGALPRPLARAASRSPRTRSTSRWDSRSASSCVTGDVIHSFWVPELARQDRSHPRPEERHVARGRQRRRLSRPVRRVLRDAARADGAVGRRRAAGEFGRVARPPARSPPRRRPTPTRAAGARRVRRLGVRALPRRPRDAAPSGRAGPRPHPPGRAAARSPPGMLPNTRGQPRGLDRQSAGAQARRDRCPWSRLGRPSCRRSSPTCRASTNGKETVATTAPGVPSALAAREAAAASGRRRPGSSASSAPWTTRRSASAIW